LAACLACLAGQDKEIKIFFVTVKQAGGAAAFRLLAVSLIKTKLFGNTLETRSV
jgi:hypothetical protein